MGTNPSIPVPKDQGRDQNIETSIIFSLNKLSIQTVFSCSRYEMEESDPVVEKYTESCTKILFGK